MHDVWHRDTELKQLTNILARGERNNAVLIGEAGVGKTALLDGLQFRVKRRSLDQPLLTKNILYVSTSDLALRLTEASRDELVQYRRQLVHQPSILFIDDVRLLFDKVDAVSLLFFIKPLLEHPKSAVVLACTMEDYRLHIEHNPVLARELERVMINELTEPQAVEVVGRLNPEVPAKVIEAAVGLSKRYLTDRSYVDNALTLVRSAAVQADHTNQLVTVELCRQLVADRTGLPLASLTTADRERMLQLEATLNRQVIGQPKVAQAITSVVQRSRAGLKDPNRPIASFLFLGSSGVGKTEMAKVLAHTVLGSERALIRFDMSEFNESHAAQRLIGAPPGYVGYEEGGQLTNAVLAQPYSLILLDEIEKAHARVFDIFLQVLDDGRLTDSKGRTVNFGDTIVVATSNIAVNEVLQGFLENKDVTARAWLGEHILPILTAFFRPEFINRFDDVLVFKPFTKEELFLIAQLELAKLKDRLQAHKAQISVDDSKLREVVEQLYDPAFGARPIRRYIQETVETTLARQILRTDGTLATLNP